MIPPARHVVAVYLEGAVLQREGCTQWHLSHTLPRTADGHTLQNGIP